MWIYVASLTQWDKALLLFVAVVINFVWKHRIVVFVVLSWSFLIHRLLLNWKNWHGSFILDDFIIFYIFFVISNGYDVLLSLCVFLLWFSDILLNCWENVTSLVPSWLCFLTAFDCLTKVRFISQTSGENKLQVPPLHLPLCFSYLYLKISLLSF